MSQNLGKNINKNIDQLIKRDAEVLLHPSSSITDLIENGPKMVVGAQGRHVVDAEGRQLLDAMAGLWCVNVGYGRDELGEAMKVASNQLGFYHSFTNASNPWQVELADKLLQLTPNNMGKVFFGTSGSDCNDTLIKIAWHYHALKGNNKKTKIIARDQAYHGTSISTASLTGLTGFHKEFPIPLDFVVRVDCPHYYSQAIDDETEEQFCDRLINNIEAMIEREGADTLAAFFAEPIMGAGGIIVPPQDYYPRLGKLLKQHDILFVADEVICGYGRLGAWFGSTEFGIEPDMIASAKGLTSGYFPLSAAFLTDEIWEVLKLGSEQIGAFMHGYTYSGHPVGAAVALANIEIMERENLIEKAKVSGKYLHEQLQSLMNLPNVGEVRGQGLIAGIQLVTDKASRQTPDQADALPAKITALMREKGVIVRPLASIGTLAVSPPLNITNDEIDTLVSALSESISSFA
ncbi:MAG: aminotransferase family protein [Pseudomonadales bacterium]|jgi:L-2,4-diaminobutyrate transaminase|tara:strand:+ start:31800 stop:33185 length:1386 start_codon:yes stop_codon:yes gene_type:complete